MLVLRAPDDGERRLQLASVRWRGLLCENSYANTLPPQELHTQTRPSSIKVLGEDVSCLPHGVAHRAHHQQAGRMGGTGQLWRKVGHRGRSLPPLLAFWMVSSSLHTRRNL